MKAFIDYSTIFILFLVSCKNENSHDKTEIDYYISQYLNGFQNKIAARGSSDKDLKIELSLKEELKNIDLNSKDTTSKIAIFIQKLESIEKHKRLLDEDMFMFENITPYVIQTKSDSSIILFDILEGSLLPSLYLKDGDSARQIKVNNYDPITINIKNPTWSNSNPPIIMDSKGFGIYSVKINGRDRNVKIEKQLICK